MVRQFDDIWFIKEDGIHYGKVAYIESAYLMGYGPKTIIKVWRENSPLVEMLDAEDENVVWFADERAAQEEWKKILEEEESDLDSEG